MKISETIGFNEYDFDIIPPNASEQIWVGKRRDLSSNLDYIKFRVENGIIIDLKINDEINTEPGIILERLINTLREYNETHQMGFESVAIKPFGQRSTVKWTALL